MDFDEILAQIKLQCSISGTTYDAYLTQEVNFAQADFTREVNFPYTETKGSLTCVADKYIYDLASNFDTIKGVTYKQKYYLQPVNYNQWLELNRYESSGIPRFYIIHEGKLKVYPSTADAAATTTLDGAITDAAATTITLAAVSSLESRGRGIVGTEVVDWQITDATNVQIKNCTRGAESTTAATHLTGATFTYRELEYSYYKTLADMASGDTSEIPARYHEALVLYASSRFFEREENLTQANNLYQRYLLILANAKKDLGEKSAQRFSTTLEDSMPRTIYDNTQPQRSSLS